jgi:acyl-CoA dehydrogenase
MHPRFPRDDYRRLAEKTKAAGLWCLGAPEPYGGGGLDTFGMSVVLEEMAQHRMGLYNAGCGVFGRYPPPVIDGGTREQIEEYAVPALRDGFHTFFAISSGRARGRPIAARTRASRPRSPSSTRVRRSGG